MGVLFSMSQQGGVGLLANSHIDGSEYGDIIGASFNARGLCVFESEGLYFLYSTSSSTDVFQEAVGAEINNGTVWGGFGNGVKNSNSRAGGLTFDGTYICLYDNDDQKIHFYEHILHSTATFSTETEFISSSSEISTLQSHFVWDITWDGEAFWCTTGTDNLVYRFDALGNIISSFDIGFPVAGITYGDDVLWIAGKDDILSIYKVEFDGTILGSIPAPDGSTEYHHVRGLAWLDFNHTAILGLDAKGTYLVDVKSNFETNEISIVKYTKTDFSEEISFSPPSGDSGISNPWGITFSINDLWLANRTTSGFDELILTNSSGEKIRQIPSPGKNSVGIAWSSDQIRFEPQSGGFIWVFAFDDATDLYSLWKVDPSDNSVVVKHETSIEFGYQVTYANDFVWIAENSSPVYKISPDTGSIVSTIPVLDQSGGALDVDALSVDSDGNIWVSDFADLYKLSSDGGTVLEFYDAIENENGSGHTGHDHDPFDPDILWITFGDAFGNNYGKFTKSTGTLEEFRYVINDSETAEDGIVYQEPVGIGVTKSNSFWTLDTTAATGALLEVNLITGDMLTEAPMPTGAFEQASAAWEQI